ncbi:MAG: SpvB/TcaC N-terminal domain-containing protein [Xenococcaceae cyanobacterium]
MSRVLSKRLIHLFFAGLSALLVLLASTVSPALAAQGVTAGATSSSFAVNQDGAATLSIPIPVPPGTAGFQPGLALSYSSQQGGGVLGVGWSLSGLSAINRCVPTEALDGQSGGVDYKSTDKFCLDGRRLIKVDESENEYEYRFVVDNFTKIVANGVNDDKCGSGPCSFTVYQPNGNIVEFGTVENSTTAAPSGDGLIAIWSISKSTDPNGNAITYSYNADICSGTTDNYLTSIEYTSNDGATRPLESRRSVKFTYYDPATYLTQYHNGLSFTWRCRLQSIATYVSDESDNEALVKKFTLNYSAGSTTNQLRLDSIQECGADDTCYSETSFSYADSGSTGGAFVSQNPVSLTGASSDGLYQAADFNGDGLTDVLQLRNIGGVTNATLFIRSKDGFSQSTPESLGSWHEDATYLVGDFNGDGFSDIAELYQVGSDISLSGYYGSSSGLSLAKWSSPDLSWPESGAFATGDFDSDGRADIGVFKNVGGALGIQSLMSTGTDFSVSSWSGVSVPWNGGFVLPGNYTSDGATSLAYARPVGNNLTVDVISYNHGAPSSSNWLDRSSDVSWSNSTEFLFGDFNGDGLGDVGYLSQRGSNMMAHALLSTAAQFVPVLLDQSFVTQADSNQYFASDLNSDQTSDWLVLTNSGGSIEAKVFLSEPGDNGLELNSVDWSIDNPGSYNGSTFLVSDFTGMGFSDIARFNQVGSDLQVQIYALSPFQPAPDKTVAPPDLLTAMTNGVKGTVAIEYAPLTNVTSKIYTKEAGSSYPVQDFQSAYWVTANHQVDDGRGDSYSYSYSYSGAKINVSSWGWLGFDSMSVTDNQLGLIETRTFSQDFPKIGALIGKSTQSTQQSGNPVLLTKTSMDYSCRTGSGTSGSLASGCQGKSGQSQSGNTLYFTNVFQVLTSSTDESAYESDEENSAISRVLKFTYDGYGNILTVSDTAIAGEKTDSLFSCYSVDNEDRDKKWLLGLVEGAKISTNKDDCKKFTSFTEDPDLRLSTFEHDDNGNLIYAQRWLATSDEDTSAGCGSTSVTGGVWLCTRYEFDDYGNVIAITYPNTAIIDPQKDQTHVEYDQTYQTFPVKVSPPLGQDGADLSVQTAYNPYFGSVESLTDPNGVTFGWSVDSLGRPQSSSGVNLQDESGSIVELSHITYRTPQDDDSGLQTTVYNSSTWQESSEGSYENWYSQSVLTDGLFRPYKIEDNLLARSDASPSICVPSTGEQKIYADITYDAVNRVSTWSLPYFSDNEKAFWEIDYNPNQTISRKEGPEGITFLWDDDLLSMQSTKTIAIYSEGKEASLAQKFTTTSDPRRQPIAATNPDGGETSYTYDPLGNLTSITDPLDVKMTFVWDTVGRLKNMTHPDTGTESYLYDLNGNLTKVTKTSGNSKQEEIKFTYDANNRPTTKTVYDISGDKTRSVIYTYDVAEIEKQLVQNTKGRLAGVAASSPKDSSNDITYALSYDGYGNVAKRTTYTDMLPSLSLGWTWNPNGQQDAMTFPDGSVMKNRYFTDGSLCSVSLEGTTYASYGGYNALRQPGNITYLNDITSSFAYDVLGRLTSEVTRSKNEELINRKYDWSQESSSPANTLTQILDSTPQGKNETFQYDSMGRMLEATGLYGTVNYSYNSGGAITSDPSQSYVYPEQSYQPSYTTDLSDPSKTLATFTFDGFGNLTQMQQDQPTPELPSLNFEFDPENQLLQASRSTESKPTTYAYDPFGLRYSKTNPDGSVTWYFGSNYAITKLPGDAGMVATKTIRGNGRAIAEITNTYTP